MHAHVEILKKEGLDEAITLFLAYLPEGKTRTSYGQDLALFRDWLASQGISGIRVSDLDQLTLAGFRDAEARRISESTLRRRMCALRSFFDWSIAQGYAASNPARELKLPRKSKPHPLVLTEAEVLRLIQMPDIRKPMGNRDRAMLSLAYYCGLRISELVGLRKSDIRYEHFKYANKSKPAVIVHGKGGKTRAIPVDDSALVDLKAWMAVRPKTDTEVIFTTSAGIPISQNTFRYTLEKYARKAGIDKPITPHSLRHSFATHLLAEGVSVFVVSKYLGHEDLSSTAVYLHLVDEDYAVGVDALPRKERRGSPVL